MEGKGVLLSHVLPRAARGTVLSQIFLSVLRGDLLPKQTSSALLQVKDDLIMVNLLLHLHSSFPSSSCSFAFLPYFPGGKTLQCKELVLSINIFVCYGGPQNCGAKGVLGVGRDNDLPSQESGSCRFQGLFFPLTLQICDLPKSARLSGNTTHCSVGRCTLAWAEMLTSCAMPGNSLHFVCVFIYKKG